MKKVIFLVLLALSANASAREYRVVCKWTDGSKEIYSQKEVWTASITSAGTSIVMNDGSRIEFSNAVQCKIVATKE